MRFSKGGETKEDEILIPKKAHKDSADQISQIILSSSQRLNSLIAKGCRLIHWKAISPTMAHGFT